ncbi:MAG: AMP-binding protein, partial [Thermoanaerobaculia bacterium]|nr:AMP-binding protein [Thermoanaerobaculia bacterium]
AAKLGAVVAPLHAQWTREERERALALLRPRLVAGGEASSAGLDGDAVRAAIDAPARPFPSLRPTSADAAAELLFTSGTTGLPKAAMQTARAMLLTGEAFAGWLGLRADDRLFTCLPLAHVNARFYSTMGALAARSALVLEERFSASAFWRQIAESRATVVNAIGAMLRILLQAPAGELDRAHRLRLVYSSPALGEALHREFEARFGVRLVIGYGLTECTFGAIHPLDLPLASAARRLDSMGRARRHPDPAWEQQLRLVDPATSADAEPRDVADGAPGEILLAGPTVFAGYFENPAATAEALRADGWLRTGDLAVRDADGFLTFAGRRKEMIRRRGENLSPLEIEQALEAHPLVREAAVIGVPGELGEEEVAAFVVPRDGAALDVEALAAWCAERLARFKVPSRWRLLDALPRTSTNRVAKAELARLYRDGAAS